MEPTKELKDALRALLSASQKYYDATTEYFSDTEYDRNGCLAEADSELTVIAIPKALAALKD